MPACPGAQASGWWVIDESTAYPKFLATDTQLQQFLVMSPSTRCKRAKSVHQKQNRFFGGSANQGTESNPALSYYTHSNSLMFTMNHLDRNSAKVLHCNLVVQWGPCRPRKHHQVRHWPLSCRCILPKPGENSTSSNRNTLSMPRCWFFRSWPMTFTPNTSKIHQLKFKNFETQRLLGAWDAFGPALPIAPPPPPPPVQVNHLHTSMWTKAGNKFLSITSHENSASCQFFHCRRYSQFSFSQYSEILPMQPPPFPPDAWHQPFHDPWPFHMMNQKLQMFMWIPKEPWNKHLAVILFPMIVPTKSRARNQLRTKSCEITWKSLQPQSLHFHSHWSRWWWLSHPHHHQIHHHHPHEPQHPERSKKTTVARQAIKPLMRGKRQFTHSLLSARNCFRRQIYVWMSSNYGP